MKALISILCALACLAANAQNFPVQNIQIKGNYTNTLGGSSAGTLTNAVTTCGADPTGVADSTSAINTCLTSFTAVSLPAGTYHTTNTILIPNKGTLRGASEGTTTITITSTTAPVITLTPSSHNIIVSDLTLDRVGVPTIGADGVYQSSGATVGTTTLENLQAQDQWDGFALGPTDWSFCNHCYAAYNYNHGFHLINTLSGATLQWQFNLSQSSFNTGWGFYVETGGSSGPVELLAWVNTGTFANTAGGYAFVGSSAAPINDIELNNCSASYDGSGGEMTFLTYGIMNYVHGGLIEGAGQGPTGRSYSTPAAHAGRGVLVETNNTDISLQGATITNNSQEGIATSGTLAVLTISGLNVTQSGASTSSSGITIGSGTQATISGVNVYNGTSQPYGIYVNSGNTASITGSYATGSVAGCVAASGSLTLAGNIGSGCAPSGAPVTPGGANTNVQYNNSGVMAGSNNLVFDGNNVTDSGAVVSTSDTVVSSLSGAMMYYDSTNGGVFQSIASPGNYNQTTLAGYTIQLKTPAGNQVTIPNSGAVSFLNRPTFAGATPWDSSNLPFTSSLGANGYQILPNGFVEEWGTATTVSSGEATGSFPYAFPTGVLSCTANVSGSTSISTAGSVGIGSAISASSYDFWTNFAGAGTHVSYHCIGH